MDVDVSPPLDDAARRALLAALALTNVSARGSGQAESTWWRAGLGEAVGEDDESAGYAPSPRNTRGATRA